MTQLTALKELADKVEAGEWDWRTDWPDWDCSVMPSIGHCRNAYNGSLDAAKALHEDVLPGWAWTFYYDGECAVEQKLGHTFCTANCSEPARAWLLCIIRAKISELESEA